MAAPDPRSILRYTLSAWCGLWMTVPTNAQYWAKDIGGAGQDQVSDLVVDTDGSIYVTGEFGGSMQVDGQGYLPVGGLDLFVARLDAAGEVIWFRTGGGAGIDRGLRVALGPGNTLAVAGEFMGSANVLGEPVASAGGTADMYVALLNKTDGSLQWLRTGGGSAGNEHPSGLTVAPNGQVTVAGEFRGVAQWSGSSLISTPDPDTGLLDTDVFVASYAPGGDLNWLQQGRAKYADRSVDLVHDAAGNLFLTGQFSDTITFDVPHPNALMNASFVLKLDPSGNEVWFKRMGGALYNQVRDLTITPDGRIFVVGDVQGTMLYFDTPQESVPGNGARAYYLLELEASGELVRYASMGSDSEVSARRVVVAGDKLVVLGTFKCRFTGLSALYDEGVFMAVGNDDLFIIEHALGDMAFIRAQQIGGHGMKTLGTAAVFPDGALVFCGSYAESLIFPATAGFAADILTGAGLGGNGADTYCGDPEYGTYAANVAAGGRDGFVTRGYVPARAPYDWWKRSGAGCDRITGDMQIWGTDTFHWCPNSGLPIFMGAYPDFVHGHVFIPTEGYGIGPSTQWAWSTGSVEPMTSYWAEGPYGVEANATNGCWAWRDTMELIHLEVPPIALISDDIVVNESAIGVQAMQICEPDAHWFWIANASEAAEVSWLVPPNNTVVPGDSVVVDTTGFYYARTFSADGCMVQNAFFVTDALDVPLPALQADIELGYPLDTDGNDTISICPYTNYEMIYTPTWIIDGAIADLPEGLLVEWYMDFGPYHLVDDGPQYIPMTTWEEGWSVAELMVRVRNDCDDTFLEFAVTDSVYILYTEQLEVQLNAPATICDGDTVLVTADCPACNNITWGGGVLGTVPPNGAIIVEAGYYVLYAVDTLGCLHVEPFDLFTPSAPNLSTDPADGILCPGASASISADASGTGHQWFGPQGPVTGTGEVLVADQAGEYFLMMEVEGCLLTSAGIHLSNYGTPFLQVLPSSVLCAIGDSLLLQVVATPGSVVEWDAPFTGPALEQVVSMPGTYTCSVEACGLRSDLSVTVTLTEVAAAVTTAGPYGICLGDSVLLQGVPTAGSGYWFPGPVLADDWWVHTPGAYVYMVEDVHGCLATAPAVVVMPPQFDVPVSANDATLCPGATVELIATGSGQLQWHTAPDGTGVLGIGSTLSFTTPSTVTIYVSQSEQGCAGPAVPVLISTLPVPDAPVITGTTVLCPGAELALQATVPDGVQVSWSTPQGSSSSYTFTVPEVSAADGGTYSVVGLQEGCPGPAMAVQVTVLDPLPIGIGDTVLLCIGGTLDLQLPDGFTQPLWSNGSNAPSVSLQDEGPIGLQAVDANGCSSETVINVVGIVCEVVLPNVFSPNGDGVNDTWRPFAGAVGIVARIHDRWGTLVHEGDVLARPWDGRHQRNNAPCSEGVYFYSVRLNGSRGQVEERSGHIQLVR
ncbi:MAG TPA: gliding motility-associated C-terminal domain-containing protein [Flavobacteriales bacterium]